MDALCCSAINVNILETFISKKTKIQKTSIIVLFSKTIFNIVISGNSVVLHDARVLGSFGWIAKCPCKLFGTRENNLVKGQFGAAAKVFSQPNILLQRE